MKQSREAEKYSFYHMTNNKYLGKCLSIVCHVDTNEQQHDGLQSSEITIFIKSGKSLESVGNQETCKITEIFDPNKPVLIRVSSDCFFGVFGDSHCDCDSYREQSLRVIGEGEQGMYVCMPQEAQGNGLLYKAKELQIQVNGIAPDGSFIGRKSIIEASEYLLGSKAVLDKRAYSSLRRIFSDLGLSKYTFTALTENPSKVEAFKQDLGIDVAHTRSVVRTLTIHNVGEYLAKIYSKDFVISIDIAEEIYRVISQAPVLPGRVYNLLKYIQEDLSEGRVFGVDKLVLQRISELADQKKSDMKFNTLSLFDENKSYRESQKEFIMLESDVDKLFAKSIFSHTDYLRYEENSFYDISFLDVSPSRYLKIRKAFKFSDIGTPVQTKLIYKVQEPDKQYKIKSFEIDNPDILALVEQSLMGHETHFLPVITHLISTSVKNITLLMKVYGKDLRTVSVMGNQQDVDQMIAAMASELELLEIDPPTNHLFFKPGTNFNFDFKSLAPRELEIFKQHFKG